MTWLKTLTVFIVRCVIFTTSSPITSQSPWLFTNGNGRTRTPNSGSTPPGQGMKLFILNGADSGPLKWIVSLQYDFDDSNVLQHFCGGSLISNQLILTAAHCLFHPNTTRMLDEAKIGVKKSRNTLHDDTKPARIDYVIVHPEYNNVRRDRNRFQHDIAVLRLKRRIALNKEQRAIELPRGVPSGFPPSGTANVSAAGWGYRTRFTGPVGDRDPEDIPERLQQANVTIISRAKCATRQPLLNITEDMFCIDSSKTDICQGDSGGAVLEDYWNETEERHITRIVGVISAASAGCGKPNSASIMTNVAKYVDGFIQPIIDDLAEIRASL